MRHHNSLTVLIVVFVLTSTSVFAYWGQSPEENKEAQRQAEWNALLVAQHGDVIRAADGTLVGIISWGREEHAHKDDHVLGFNYFLGWDNYGYREMSISSYPGGWQLMKSDHPSYQKYVMEFIDRKPMNAEMYYQVGEKLEGLNPQQNNHLATIVFGSAILVLMFGIWWRSK